MHTLSSASRTCMASAAAVECTATVLMPISRQARWIRSAISPRLAIRTFSNTGTSLQDHQGLAELDRLAVVDQHRLDGAGAGRGDRVHHLHRLDDQQGGALGDLAARRSEEHTSELQSLMRISYAVLCLKKNKKTLHNNNKLTTTS